MAATPPSAAAAAAAAGGVHSVFVYGSLMTDEVVSAIINCVPSSSPALLLDQDASINVIMGVTDAELILVDAFEYFEYVRRRVQMSLTDTSETMLADTYVWSDAEDPNLYGEWDFEEWKKLHMKDFLTMTLGFMHGLERPESKTRVETYQSFMHELEKPE